MAFRVALLLPFLLIAGCVGPEPGPTDSQEDLDPMAPLEPLDLTYEGCRWLRAFLDYDPGPTDAALPEGYTPHTSTTLDYVGFLDIYRCEASDEDPPITLALAGVAATPPEREHPDSNRYAFDILVDDPGLAEALNARGLEATLAEITLASDLYGFLFTATADGLHWTDTHARSAVEETPISPDTPETMRWHMDAAGHGWIEVQESRHQATMGTPFNVGKAVVQLEGGTSGPLIKTGERSNLYSLDALLDLHIRIDQVHSVE